nr:hypothetical protein [Lachnospiraceae bacterium]
MGVLLMMRKEKSSRYMGASTLILGFGDAFHLIPRVLNYFVDADLTTVLGLGKLITSITMTVFYILVFRIWLCVLLSFLFYMPVATAVSYFPILGMLMIPKTICYILIVWSFYRYNKKKRLYVSKNWS